jgi:hypothetical protein
VIVSERYYIDENIFVIKIDTFNDFGEWLYIEPSTSSDFAFLEELQAFLQTRTS